MFVLLFSPRVVPGFIYKNRTTATPSGPVIIIGKCSQRQGSGTGQHVIGKTTVRPFNCQVHQYNLFNFSSTLPNKFHQINFFFSAQNDNSVSMRQLSSSQFIISCYVTFCFSFYHVFLSVYLETSSEFFIYRL